MKTIVLKIIIAIVLSTSVSAFSQNWQPRKITFEAKEGLFIPFDLMDTISVKLIERKGLLTQNYSLGTLVTTLAKKNDELVQKSLILSNTSLKWESLYNREREITGLLSESLKDQTEISENNKKRGARNGLYLFSGGVVIGAVGLLLLIN